MRQFVLGVVVALTVAAGCAYASTWTTLPIDENLPVKVAECFHSGSTARVVIIYNDFEGTVEEVRCYPQGGVN